ncbi:hypothetical protein M408DRAFT_164815 [Serendipita vermifera MAFF 305830]|uniref:Uncharacterized protein n=1 Tax=Serendipita vermifera MAFF 305830 TaxID=933852 RepID=A0A0C3B7K2_SERVB|nr:hypothetical protein M408DRAFT_164815 [Serendipita vermifera MAFF 305830]
MGPTSCSQITLPPCRIQIFFSLGSDVLSPYPSLRSPTYQFFCGLPSQSPRRRPTSLFMEHPTHPFGDGPTNPFRDDPTSPFTDDRTRPFADNPTNPLGMNLPISLWMNLPTPSGTTQPLPPWSSLAIPSGTTPPVPLRCIQPVLSGSSQFVPLRTTLPVPLWISPSTLLSQTLCLSGPRSSLRHPSFGIVALSLLPALLSLPHCLN